ncbi:restriction endonuclease subunit S [Ruminococcus sp.]|uniref:restriction endonuclease subunit S n=1 Tax=Ruminococcus sp. TaxID=41978 RepID=UPI003AF68CC1
MTVRFIVNVRNISSSSILLDERELDEICLPCTQAEKYLVSNESILIARSGIPGAPRILYNPSKDIIFCGFIICATPIDSILQHYLMLFLKQLEGSTATQTGGSILKNVSQDTLRDLLVPIPSKDILTQFNQRVALIYEFMHNNLEETSKLQHLRDWLLPMLMNGQATISD